MLGVALAPLSLSKALAHQCWLARGASLVGERRGGAHTSFQCAEAMVCCIPRYARHSKRAGAAPTRTRPTPPRAVGGKLYWPRQLPHIPSDVHLPRSSGGPCHLPPLPIRLPPPLSRHLNLAWRWQQRQRQQRQRQQQRDRPCDNGGRAAARAGRGRGGSARGGGGGPGRCGAGGVAGALLGTCHGSGGLPREGPNVGQILVCLAWPLLYRPQLYRAGKARDGEEDLRWAADPSPPPLLPGVLCTLAPWPSWARVPGVRTEDPGPLDPTPILCCKPHAPESSSSFQ